MKIGRFSILLFLSHLLFSTSCVSSKIIPRKTQKDLNNKLENSPIFAKGFTGFQLYDPSSKTVLHEQFSNKYFTPASNTKIFTFYAASKILGDTIPALKYIIRKDSLIFWGTGDPSLLHPRLNGTQKVISFLKNSNKQLFYCGDNFMDERYSSGWMWDDYPYYFQVEKAALPIYGNYIRVTGTKDSYSFQITPNYFTNKILGQPNLGGNTARFYRQKNSNVIEYNQKRVGKKDIDRELPFIYSDSLTIKLLQNLSGKRIQLISGLGIPPLESATIYSISKDSVLQRMMVQSDNFLAEQLILLCGNTAFDTLNTAMGIQLAKNQLFADAPEELLWYDGSGLTRYNQFTPRSLIYVLEKIYQEIPKEKWPIFFQDGTHYGKPKDKNIPFSPFIFAKSGSMRNVRCLSGFLFTRSGRTLLFSFMNNHIPGGSGPWNAEMERVLVYLHEEL